jgi:Xaa-Pro aminopeptidase
LRPASPVENERAQFAKSLAALQERQFDAMRPGTRAAEVDRILRQGVLAAGMRGSYANITGYTLGYYSRQPLRSSDFTRSFHPAADWQLGTGMVFHMYTSAGGISFSETIVVRPGGAERLTQLPRVVLTAARA